MADQLFKKRKKLRFEKELEERKKKSETWLIVSEGTKTEPNYINSLLDFANAISKESPIKKQVKGIGKNTKTLVESVEDFYDEIDKMRSQKIGSPYAKVFVIFDKDSFTADQFNSAIAIAENKGYIPIWSNECFELWFILHFQYYTTDNGRDAYFTLLSDLLCEKYEKSADIFSKIHSPKNISQAVKFSKKLYNSYNSIETTPSKMVPCTKMFLFVEEVNNRLKIDLCK